VVSDYYRQTGLDTYLQRLGFYIVGYGCTTCIGNSGPLDKEIREAIEEGKLDVAAVLSGNRNFSGRINPYVRSSWLASPMLVVAYAIAGTTRIDLESEPIGHDTAGTPVYLRDIWPSHAEIREAMRRISVGMFRKEYARVFEGNEEWRSLRVTAGKTFSWDPASTYIKQPPFFVELPKPTKQWEGIAGARALALFGDGVTTDHISPAGDIALGGPAATYLLSNGIDVADFNSYGTRRGNHEVMIRGTFANVRIRNEMVPGIEGGMTRHFPDGEVMSIYDAAMKYAQEDVPLVVIAGKEYGTGSSRDWAAKGTKLLGVRAVIAESFERIHRSNLVGVGVMPLQFADDADREDLALTGKETLAVVPPEGELTPGCRVHVEGDRTDGSAFGFDAICRLDTEQEIEYFAHGGILNYVLAGFIKKG
jgi:aconitate hydratase